MMGVKFKRSMRIFMLTLITLGNLTVEIMAARINQVVFQTFQLEYETFQCYGHCSKDFKDPSKDDQKFNVSRCEGLKIRFGCNEGYNVKVQSGLLGKLSPELDICTQHQALDCEKDVTKYISQKCKEITQCNMDITGEPLKSKCGIVKHLALKIKYLCELAPTTVLTTTFQSRASSTTNKINKSTREEPTSVTESVKPTKPEKVVTAVKKSEKSSQKAKGTPHTFVTYKSSMATKKYLSSTISTTNTIKIEKLSNEKSTHMFWTLTAYAIISNSDFIKGNKIHLALALVFSMFLGILFALCFFVSCCMVKKRRKAKHLLESAQSIHSKRGVLQHEDTVELLMPDPTDEATLSRSSSRNKCSSCYETTFNNNAATADTTITNDNTYENIKINNDNKICICESSEPMKPLLGRRFNHDNSILASAVVAEESALYLSSLPPPPNELLQNSSSSSSGELLSPPKEFKETLKDIPSLTFTIATPTNASTDTLMTAKKSNPLGGCESDIIEVEELFFENSNDDTLEGSDYEYVEMGQYHASDEYSSSPQISRSISYHRTDNHGVSSDLNISHKKRGISNDETSQEDTITRSVESNIFAKKRIRKCYVKDRTFQKSKSFDDSRKRVHVCRGDQILVRNPRKGRVHVLQRCDETLPRNYSQKVINSDNEAARRRRQCELEFNQSGSSACDVHCITCKNCGEANIQAFSSTSNCQSSHEDDCEDDMVIGPIHSSEKFLKKNIVMKNKRFIVEESGYQSHDTGTDSLCSSTFSTDLEDNRMFSPVPVNSLSRNGCRSKDCHYRGQTSKRDKRLVLVCDHGTANSKAYRRCKCDGHSTIDVYRKDSHASRDARFYDSSLDNANVRDSLKKTPKSRKLKTNACSLTSFDEERKKCSCIHLIVPPDEIVKIDGMETL